MLSSSCFRLSMCNLHAQQYAPHDAAPAGAISVGPSWILTAEAAVPRPGDCKIWTVTATALKGRNEKCCCHACKHPAALMPEVLP